MEIMSTLKFYWDFFNIGMDSDFEQVWRLTRALCHFLAFGDNK